MAISRERGKLSLCSLLGSLTWNAFMTNKAMLDQRSVAHYDEVISDPTQTNVGDAIVHNSIVKHSSSPRRSDQSPTEIDGSSVIDTRLDINSSDTNIKTDWPTALDVGIRPEVLTSVATVSNNIVDGGKMTFVGRLTDTTSHLVALIHDAVSSTPLSFLSDMLPAMSAPETVSAPHLRSSAAPSATPIAAFSLVESTTPSNRKLPSTFEHGERAVTVSGLNGTRSRESGGVLLRFLKSLLSSILTTKPANGGNHTRIMPPPWSARPMAFARYARPRVQAPGGRSNEMEKRHHFSDK